jgi:membrane protease subunit HflC
MTFTTKAKFLVSLAIILLIVAVSSTFIVKPDEQVIVIKFGDPQRIIQEPGLHFKIPFIEELVKYSKKSLPLDIPAKEIIMSDKSRVLVDTFSLFRIADPLKFYQRARTLSRAMMLLQQQLVADLNKTIAKVNFDVILSDRRSEVMAEIVSEMKDSAGYMGVEIVDIRIRRADVPTQISRAIYDRMISERDRIAKQFRAIGDERAQAIKAEANRQSTVIIAEANRDAEKMRGEGDAKAADIYEKTYSQNQKFYAFYRHLQAYEKALAETDEKPTFIINPKKFKFFDQLSQ